MLFAKEINRTPWLMKADWTTGNKDFTRGARTSETVGLKTPSKTHSQTMSPQAKKGGPIL